MIPDCTRYTLSEAEQGDGHRQAKFWKNHACGFVS